MIKSLNGRNALVGWGSEWDSTWQWGPLRHKSLRDRIKMQKNGGDHVACTLQTELGLQPHGKVFKY